MVKKCFTKMSCNLLAAIQLKLSDLEERGECMLPEALGAALALGQTFAFSLAQAETSDIGQTAPQFSLSTTNGSQLSVSVGELAPAGIRRPRPRTECVVMAKAVRWM